MMADLHSLVSQEIPKGRQDLTDSHGNLERVAEYCEGNYFNSENRRAALEETKNFTTQSLASVAYQINTLAYNFVQMLDLQQQQLTDMNSQITSIAQTVQVHKEKVARREIGVLTTNKPSTRQFKIIAPANPERPIKYTRRPIDFSLLDDVGHAVRLYGSGQATLPRQARQGSTASLQTPVGGQYAAGPAPTTKPPTPPMSVRSGMGAGGTLTRANKEYRTPPAIAPPQVPGGGSNYVAGQGRHYTTDGRPGYASMQRTTSANAAGPPKVGTVHPMYHDDSRSQLSSSDRAQQHAPLSTQLSGGGGARSVSAGVLPSAGMVGLSTLRLRNTSTGGLRAAASPLYQDQQSDTSPLPPPPDVESAAYGSLSERARPGWVPANYVEKVVAVYDYNADKEDELSFSENSVIYVLKKNDDGWWEGVMDGITGLFPGNYVEPLMS